MTAFLQEPFKEDLFDNPVGIDGKLDDSAPNSGQRSMESSTADVLRQDRRRSFARLTDLTRR